MCGNDEYNSWLNDVIAKISQLMNEKKDSVDKLLHLVNNDISLIVGVPT